MKFWSVEQQKVLNRHGPGSETPKHVEIQKSRDSQNRTQRRCFEREEAVSEEKDDQSKDERGT